MPVSALQTSRHTSVAHDANRIVKINIRIDRRERHRPTGAGDTAEIQEREVANGGSGWEPQRCPAFGGRHVVMIRIHDSSDCNKRFAATAQSHWQQPVRSRCCLASVLHRACLILVGPQHRDEGLLRNVDIPELLHLGFALLLFLKQFFLS